MSFARTGGSRIQYLTGKTLSLADLSAKKVPRIKGVGCSPSERQTFYREFIDALQERGYPLSPTDMCHYLPNVAYGKIQKAFHGGGMREESWRELINAARALPDHAPVVAKKSQFKVGETVLINATWTGHNWEGDHVKVWEVRLETVGCRYEYRVKYPRGFYNGVFHPDGLVWPHWWSEQRLYAQ